MHPQALISAEGAALDLETALEIGEIVIDAVAIFCSSFAFNRDCRFGEEAWQGRVSFCGEANQPQPMKTQKKSQRLLLRKGNNNCWKSKVMKINRKTILSAVLALLLFHVAPVRGATIYVTADNGATNLFGTLDPATGQFNQIATTTPLFFALTTGPGGKIYGADVSSGNLYTISTSGVTTQYGSTTAPSAFYGLAYSSSTGNFFATNLDPMNVTLYSIAGDGNSNSLVGEIAGPNSGFFPTGNLAFGPGANLYFDYSTDLVNNGANSTLYTVNASTGALTVVGSGLGTDILALFSDGTTLYGVDSIATSDIGIYTINTTTGVATQVSTVTGLPSDGGYFVDTATSSVPDTGSTLKLLFLALSALLVGSRPRRCAGLTPGM